MCVAHRGMMRAGSREYGHTSEDDVRLEDKVPFQLLLFFNLSARALQFETSQLAGSLSDSRKNVKNNMCSCEAWRLQASLDQFDASCHAMHFSCVEILDVITAQT